jgi:hypothetical protein
MATIAFAALGSSVATSGFGFAAGGIAASLFSAGFAIGGAYLDSQFLLPVLFPASSDQRQPIEGPRLDDIPRVAATEGAPLPFLQGRENRVGGVLLWAGELEEVRIETIETVSGKGGGILDDVFGVDPPDFDIRRVRYEYYRSFAIGVADASDGPMEALRRVWADSKLIYWDGDQGEGTFDDIRFYGGDQTSADSLISADPVMLALAGGSAPDVPHFRKMAYYVVERLLLNDFGNRIPTMSALVQENEQRLWSEVLGTVCERYGLSSDQFDFTRIGGCCRGYAVSGVVSGASVIEPILRYKDAFATTENGKVVAFERGLGDVVVVPTSDLVPTREGRRALLSRGRADRPSAVRVRFQDRGRDYQTSQTRATFANGLQNEVTVDLPMPLNPAEARAVAHRIVTRGQFEHENVAITLPPKYRYVTVGTVISTNDGVQPIVFRVDRATHGANGLVQLSGRTTAEGVGQFVAALDDEGDSDISSYVPPLLQVLSAHPGALSRSQSTYPGVQVAVQRLYLVGTQYRGATYYDSPDDVAFSAIKAIPSEAAIWRVIAVEEALRRLGAGYEAVIHWGRTIDVYVDPNNPKKPQSRTYAEVASGANHVILRTGDDFLRPATTLAFINASDQGGGVWRLRDIMIAPYGGDPSAPNVGDDLILIDGSQEFVPLPAIGSDRFLKVVPNLATVADVESLTVENTARNVKAGRISRAWVEPWDTDGNRLLRWQPSLKYPFPMGVGPDPKVSGERFVVELWPFAATTSPYRVVETSNRFYLWEYDDLVEAGYLSSGGWAGSGTVSGSRRGEQIHFRITPYDDTGVAGDQFIYDPDRPISTLERTWPL